MDGDDALPPSIIDLLNNRSNTIVVSIASIWEIAVKISLKKLEISKSLGELEGYLLQTKFEMLSIKLSHLNTLQYLPFHHRDPFDRMLIAQAITENIEIVSADRYLKSYGIPIIW